MSDQLFDISKIKTHSKTEKDFPIGSVITVKGDKVHPNEIQVYLKYTIQDGIMYIL